MTVTLPAKYSALFPKDKENISFDRKQPYGALIGAAPIMASSSIFMVIRDVDRVDAAIQHQPPSWRFTGVHDGPGHAL
jgi:hypothetical protein